MVNEKMLVDFESSQAFSILCYHYHYHYEFSVREFKTREKSKKNETTLLVLFSEKSEVTFRSNSEPQKVEERR